MIECDLCGNLGAGGGLGGAGGKLDGAPIESATIDIDKSGDFDGGVGTIGGLGGIWGGSGKSSMTVGCILWEKGLTLASFHFICLIWYVIMVMLVTTLCWWLGDSFNMLVANYIDDFVNVKNQSPTSQIGHQYLILLNNTNCCFIDVVDGCRRRFMSVTSKRCSWPIWAVDDRFVISERSPTL